MKALVTGGAGFVGSHLTKELVASGNEVTVFDNVDRGNRDRLDPVLDKITFVEGDIRSEGKLKDASDNPDVIFHLAAINGTKHFYDRPMDVLDVNLAGTRNIVNLANEQNVDRVLFTSSSEVYGFPREFPTPEEHPLQIMDSENPRYSYAGGKIVGEQYVIHGATEDGYDYTIVRPHNLYGPEMGYDHVIPEFIERILNDEKFTVYGDGTQTRSFCYISDAINAITTSVTRTEGANEIYNIGTQDEITINELAKHLFDIAEVNPKIEHIESKELSGSPKRRQPDISNAKGGLDYDPQVSLSSGLERTFDAYCRDLIGVTADKWRSS
ncbi:NAD-dependent epimerase/dehydratase family protein [Halobellus sp. EA9]|uniref:NAD-dependent epimerase/dehydratase family protein n=1 Tax=Halobellus sp. EA9 TaxID=3421647 RepID=UPI003EB83A89